MYSTGLAYLGAFGLALSWRQTWPLSVIGLLQLAAFSVISHKELRFSLPLVPIYLIGLAVFFTEDGQRRRPLLPGFAAYVPLTRRIVVVLVAATVVIGIGTWIGLDDYIHQRRQDVRQSYLFLSRRSDVRGVIDDSGVEWWNLGGYYDLHQSAPIYRPDLPLTQIPRVRQSPQLFASHWLTSADVTAPEGYELLARTGGIAIWRRSRDPPETLVAPGYSTNAPIRAAPSKVTPRW